jgi:hypothetical protein
MAPPAVELRLRDYLRALHSLERSCNAGQAPTNNDLSFFLLGFRAFLQAKEFAVSRKVEDTNPFGSRIAMHFELVDSFEAMRGGKTANIYDNGLRTVKDAVDSADGLPVWGISTSSRTCESEFLSRSLNMASILLMPKLQKLLHPSLLQNIILMVRSLLLHIIHAERKT